MKAYSELNSSTYGSLNCQFITSTFD